MGESRPSNWKYWPTDDEPDKRYKLASIIVIFSQNLTEINRKTYSGLEWLGDIGGLFDGLSYLGKIMMGPLSAMALKAELLTHIFALEPN